MTVPERLILRPMVESDLDAVMAIERGAGSAPHWNESDYLTFFQFDIASSLKRDSMICEVDGKVAGFAIVRLVGGSGFVEAELESIVVAPECRGRGVGGVLLADLQHRAKDHGAVRMDLEVREGNAGAIRLYRRAGFVETGRRRGYYRDPDEDAVLMSVSL